MQTEAPPIFLYYQDNIFNHLSPSCVYLFLSWINEPKHNNEVKKYILGKVMIAVGLKLMHIYESYDHDM